MSKRFLIGGLLAVLCALPASGQEHRVEVVKEAPKVDGLNEEVAALFSEEGLKVIRGTSRTVCEIWPCKQWDAMADFKPTLDRLYPFKPGQLIGILHFKRRGKEFRDSTISSGWYTLRYGLQPIDGNHVGTSPTRDFLMMVRAEDDKSSKPMPVDDLIEASTEAGGAAHPAMLCLQRVGKDAPKKPSLSHNEDKDWWTLHFTGKTKVAGKDKTQDLPVAMVVVGHAEE